MKRAMWQCRFIQFLAVAIATGLCTVSANADGSRSKVASGQSAPAFTGKTLEGKTVSFPGDYKGKVVLLDFWATWCGPCRRELPNVKAAYDQYHARGFEILGISLDRPQQGPELIKFTKENGMPWSQVYDGLYWKAAVAVQYGVHSIPCPILVDGDTGMVLGDSREVLGERLGTAIEKALASKGKQGT